MCRYEGRGGGGLIYMNEGLCGYELVRECGDVKLGDQIKEGGLTIHRS